MHQYLGTSLNRRRRDLQFRQALVEGDKWLARTMSSDAILGSAFKLGGSATAAMIVKIVRTRRTVHVSFFVHIINLWIAHPRPSWTINRDSTSPTCLFSKG